MMKTTRWIACITCVLVCVTTIFSCAWIAAEAMHDCSDESCRVCAEIRLHQAFLRTLAYVAVFIIVIHGIGAVLCGYKKSPTGRRAQTPVSLKVKLTN